MSYAKAPYRKSYQTNDLREAILLHLNRVIFNYVRETRGRLTPTIGNRK
jgi:hypothetical protein